MISPAAASPRTLNIQKSLSELADNFDSTPPSVASPSDTRTRRAEKPQMALASSALASSALQEREAEATEAHADPSPSASKKRQREKTAAPKVKEMTMTLRKRPKETLMSNDEILNLSERIEAILLDGTFELNSDPDCVTNAMDMLPDLIRCVKTFTQIFIPSWTSKDQDARTLMLIALVQSFPAITKDLYRLRCIDECREFAEEITDAHLVIVKHIDMLKADFFEAFRSATRADIIRPMCIPAKIAGKHEHLTKCLALMGSDASINATQLTDLKADLEKFQTL